MLNDVYGEPDYEETWAVYDPHFPGFHKERESIWYTEKTIVYHRRAGGIMAHRHSLVFQEKAGSFYEILQREESAGRF